MKYHVFVLSFVLSLILCTNVIAQRHANSWAMGVFGGINESVYVTNWFHFPAGTRTGFENGSAEDFTGGISAERFLLSEGSRRNIALLFKSQYNASRGAFAN